jgi:diguanylate cyclase (GGDEF)-like protein/PAS domain S-box-containing protein
MAPTRPRAAPVTATIRARGPHPDADWRAAIIESADASAAQLFGSGLLGQRLERVLGGAGLEVDGAETALRLSDGRWARVRATSAAHDTFHLSFEVIPPSVIDAIVRAQRRDAFDSAVVGQALIDHEGRWLEVNAYLCDLLGYSPAELRSMRFPHLIHPQDLAQVLAGRDRLVSGEVQRFSAEVRYRRRAGGVVWCELHVALLEPLPLERERFAVYATEITERKRLEADLLLNEQRLALALEGAGMAWWEHDRAHDVHRSSPNMAQLLGFAPGTYHDSLEAFLAMVHPDDRAMIAGMNADPRTWRDRFEYRFRGPDGVERWLESRSKTVFDANGEVERVLGVTTDITERKRQERDLAETQQRLELSLHSAAMGWWSWNFSDELIQVSDGFARLLGYAPHEFPGGARAFAERLVPEDFARMRAMTQSPQHWPASFDYRVNLPGGQVRWISSRARVFFDEGGAPVRVVGVDTDITERHLAGRELEATRERLELALSSADIGWWEWHALEDRHRWSPNLERLLGYEPGTYPGTPDAFLARVHPDDRALFDGPRSTAIRHEEFDFRVVWPDGSVRWLTTRSKRHYRADGTLERIIGVDVDITARKRVEQELLEIKARLELAFSSTEMAWWEWDVLEDRHRWSPQLERLLGYELGTYPGTPEAFLARVHPEDRALLDADIATNGPRREEFDFRVVWPDGTERWLNTRSKTYQRADGRLERIIGVDADITARKRVEQELLETAARLELALSSAQMGWWELDPRADRHRWSPGYERLLGYEPGTYPGTPDAFLARVHPDDRAQFALETQSMSAWPEDVDYRVVFPNGEERWISSRSRVIRGADGNLERIIGVDLDITARKRAEVDLVRRATHDPLTELPNRRTFTERLEHAIQMARRSNTQLAVVFLDLDRFKTVNDSLGHGVGDALLMAVAQRLKEALRGDDTVARLGGDEFTMILPAVRNVENGTVVAEKLLRAFDEPFVLNDHEVVIGASLGISLYPSDGEDSETLLRHADDAKRRAKRGGRSQYQFYRSEMTFMARVQLELERDLRRALERGEFSLHYQAQFSLERAQPVGAEALLRWQHPTRGFVPPSEFIPVAEESGLIVPIGDWVLREACRQLAQWRKDIGSRLRMAVNVSALQFERHDLLQTVRDALEEHNLEPRFLELELTESLVMRDVAGSATQLRALRDHGVQIAVDDFGTGYSSLAYLQRLPIDRLKIDRTFIKDLGGEHDTAPLVQAIIALAHTLGMEVVAEGIETTAQMETLRRLHCEYAQGYLLARPVPSDAFLEHVQASTLR